MRVDVQETTESGSQLSVVVTRTPPAMVAPLAVLGLVAGALAGWLLVAWATRGNRRDPLAATLYSVGGVLLLPATALNAVVMVGSYRSPAEPMPVWAGYMFLGARALTIIGVFLLVTAGLLVTRRRRAVEALSRS
jgi:hypothetical protein